MPLYQFRCKDCGVLFEESIEQPDDHMSCPHCESNSVKKLFLVNVPPTGFDDDDNESTNPC